jgi:hypothetical protein
MPVTRHSDPDAFLAAAAPMVAHARIGFRAENDDWHVDFVPPEP